MANCKFDVTISGSVSEEIKKVSKEIIDNGGTFTGDDSKGSFTIPKGTIEGNYTVNGQILSITITKKFFMIPCSRIEKEVKKFFGDNS